MFIRVNNIIVEDGLLIRGFKEFFCIVYLDESLLVWIEFFDILIRLEMLVITIRQHLTHQDVSLIFYIEFSLVFRTQIRTWP